MTRSNADLWSKHSHGDRVDVAVRTAVMAASDSANAPGSLGIWPQHSHNIVRKSFFEKDKSRLDYQNTRIAYIYVHMGSYNSPGVSLHFDSLSG